MAVFAALILLLSQAHGFLLEPSTTQALMEQVSRVNSLQAATRVLTLMAQEVTQLQQVLRKHDGQLNQAQGQVFSNQGGLQQLQQSLVQLNSSFSPTSASTLAPTPTSGTVRAGGGASYIRWGRTSCPAESELVYKGTAGGKGSGEAGGTNLLCMHEDPQWANYTVTKAGALYAHVWGSEYAIPYNPLPNFHPNHDVPCAVCRSPTRSTALMIPARTDCYPSFHREYTGYLMSNYYDAAGDYEFVCVDSMPESGVGSQRADGGTLLYFALGICGSLPCPPYEANREMACVVCTK